MGEQRKKKQKKKNRSELGLELYDNVSEESDMTLFK